MYNLFQNAQTVRYTTNYLFKTLELEYLYPESSSLNLYSLRKLWFEQSTMLAEHVHNMQLGSWGMWQPTIGRYLPRHTSKLRRGAYARQRRDDAPAPAHRCVSLLAPLVEKGLDLMPYKWDTNGSLEAMETPSQQASIGDLIQYVFQSARHFGDTSEMDAVA